MARCRGLVVLSLLRCRQFDVLYPLFTLHSTVDDFRRRATGVQRACARLFPSLSVRQTPVDLIGVIDYQEIYRVANDVCQRILDEVGRDNHNYFVYLSPGTPQMQTVWILLVQSGLLPARMLDAIPPDLLTPGARSWRDVSLTVSDFPRIVSPAVAERRLAILETQISILEATNLRLEAENRALRAEGARDNPLLGDFDLKAHLRAQERWLYLRALDQAGGNAAGAARLLKMRPHTFRARAQTLGIRARQMPA